MPHAYLREEHSRQRESKDQVLRENMPERTVPGFIFQTWHHNMAHPI